MKLIHCCVFFILTWRHADSDGNCSVVSRKEWNGRTPDYWDYLPRPVSLVFMHVTSTSTCETDSHCAELVRSIQIRDMDRLNYWDIGPSFLVGGNGKIYEGAGWFNVGGHNLGYNKQSIGITFIGKYNIYKDGGPNKEQLEAVKTLLKCGVELGHLTPNYYMVSNWLFDKQEKNGYMVLDAIMNWPHYLSHYDAIKNKFEDSPS